MPLGLGQPPDGRGALTLAQELAFLTNLGDRVELDVLFLQQVN